MEWVEFSIKKVLRVFHSVAEWMCVLVGVGFMHYVLAKSDLPRMRECVHHAGRCMRENIFLYHTPTALMAS